MFVDYRQHAMAALLVVGLLFLAACGRSGQFEASDDWYDSLKFTSFGRD